MDEMKGNPKLAEEYENTFDSEEKISHSLKMDKDSFNVSIGVVYFDSLLIPDPLKKGRKETYLGLSTSIAELGILSPIHVMQTESYMEYLNNKDDEDEEFEGFKYVLIDGFRRVWGGYKNGLTRCNAVIWSFKDPDKGNDLLVVLSSILNKIQKRSWSEVWYMLGILEEQSSLTPNTLEYLLSLESGDSMRLKDVMMCDYQDIKDDLISNKKTLLQAYNVLQKYRKEEDKLLKDDNTGISEVEQAEGVVEKAEGDRVLADDEVKEILEMDDTTGDSLSEDDFDENMFSGEPERQTVGDRHPLDPAIKAESLLRDGYKCTCCEVGENYPMRYAMSILQSHHKISVSNSGPDAVENIATVCQNCHTIVHTLLKNNMKFGMSKETFDKLPEEKKTVLLNIRKLANIDYEAGKRLGKTKEDFRKDNQNSSKFKMPGTDLVENKKALEMYEGKSDG